MQKNQPLLRMGTVLVSIYGVLAFAAIGRSSYELATKFSQAPFPYALSAFSAVVYLLATICLARNTEASLRVAMVALLIEMAGVITVGFSSYLVPQAFTYAEKPIHTVWSYFGVGYGFVPLILPFVGLVWLRKHTSK